MGLLRIIKYHMRSNRKRRRNKVMYVSIILFARENLGRSVRG